MQLEVALVPVLITSLLVCTDGVAHREEELTKFFLLLLHLDHRALGVVDGGIPCRTRDEEQKSQLASSVALESMSDGDKVLDGVGR